MVDTLVFMEAAWPSIGACGYMGIALYDVSMHA